MAGSVGKCRDCGDEIDTTDGRELCNVCDPPLTVCPDCTGRGSNCGTCHGSGICPWCDGYGLDHKGDECTACFGFGVDNDRIAIRPGETGPGWKTNVITFDEPVWYTLSEIIERTPDLPPRPWEELMALAQILHDLKIDDANALMRKLDVVYVEDSEKPLRGEYHYANGDKEARPPSEIGKGHGPKKEKAKNSKPIMSSRRQAIMAQKEKKNEGS